MQAWIVDPCVVIWETGDAGGTLRPAPHFAQPGMDSEENPAPKRKPPGLGRKILRWTLGLLSLGLWCLAALVLTILGVGSLIPGFVLALGLVGLVVFKSKVRGTFAVVLGLCLVITVWRSMLEPSNERDWQPQLSVLPRPVIDGDTLVLHGVRNFRWQSATKGEPAWETRRYRLGNLRSVDLIFEPFAHSSLMAHTMMSFDFGEDGRLVLSIEARKEVGEDYSAITGGLNQFELIYLFLDERDALGVRAHRDHELYVFPVRAERLHLRAFFLSLCASADNLRRKPQFYHIIRHNCTTVWLEHADHISNEPVGLRLESILNGLIVELLHKRGFIDTDLSYEEAKKAFRVDRKIHATPMDETFPEAIRSGFPAGRTTSPGG